jgi:hypothetical protein
MPLAIDDFEAKLVEEVIWMRGFLQENAIITGFIILNIIKK